MNESALMKKVCDLCFEQALDIVAKTEKPIHLQKGYFSRPTIRPVSRDEAIDALHTAPYGAEIWESGESLVVLMPTVSDMW